MKKKNICKANKKENDSNRDNDSGDGGRQAAASITRTELCLTECACICAGHT